jgi:hypothetical protein
MKPAIERIELSTEELERVLEWARVEPLPEARIAELERAAEPSKWQ